MVSSRLLPLNAHWKGVAIWHVHIFSRNVNKYVAIPITTIDYNTQQSHTWSWSHTRFPCIVVIRNYEYHGTYYNTPETNKCRSYKHMSYSGNWTRMSCISVGSLSTAPYGGCQKIFKWRTRLVVLPLMGIRCAHNIFSYEQLYESGWIRYVAGRYPSVTHVHATQITRITRADDDAGINHNWLS